MDKQLYLEWNGKGYDLKLKFFNQDENGDDGFFLKEAAILILYPDGVVEAVKVGSEIHHTNYYHKLYGKSERFKSIIDSLDLPFNWQKEDSTYKLDCYLARRGLTSFHNINIHDIPFRLEELENFVSLFYFFKSEFMTDEVDNILNKVYENYDCNSIVNNRFNSETNKFERENREPIRRM